MTSRYAIHKRGPLASVMDSEKQLASYPSGQRRGLLNTDVSSPPTTARQQKMVKRNMFPAPGWTMLRQFSCKQLYRKGNVAQVTHEKVCLVSDDGNVYYLNSTSRGLACVSRGIDEKSTFSDVRKQSSGAASLTGSSRKQSSCPAGQTGSFGRVLKLWLASGLLLIVASAVMMFMVVDSDDICRCALDTNVLEQVLKYKLYGQEQAGREIMTHMVMFSVSEGPRVEAMVFYGDTGVGKSYTASLIGKYFTWPRNIQHLIPSVRGHSISSADEVISNLSLCGGNLVIVDGLSIGQEDASVQFLDALYLASISSGFRVIVILIFNVQQSYRMLAINEQKIEYTFKHKADLILFQPLEEQHINMCVMEMLLRQGIRMSKEDVAHLLSTVVPLHTGCKSVASKVTLLGRKQM